MDCDMFNRVALLKNKASAQSAVTFQLWNIWRCSKYNMRLQICSFNVILPSGAKEKESTTSFSF